MSDNLTWVACKPCGCVVAAMAYSNEPSWMHDIQKQIEAWRHGHLIVERVSDDWFREHGLDECHHDLIQLTLDSQL